MTHHRNLLSILTLTTAIALASPAFAQQADVSSLPSIEINLDALKAPGSPAMPTRSMPAETMVAPATATETTTSGEPKMIWQKGPDGAPAKVAPTKKYRTKVAKKPKPSPAPEKIKAPEAVVEKPKAPVAEAPKPKDKPAPKADEKATAVPAVNIEEKKPAPPAPEAKPAPAAAPEVKKPEATPPAPPAPAAAQPAPPPPPPPAPAAAQPAPPAAPIAPKGPAEAPAKPVNLVPMPKASSAPVVPVETTATTATPATPTPAPEAAATQAPAAPAGKVDLVIIFKATETSLPLSMKDQVDAVVGKLKADETLRVNLIAYASAGADQASTVRRVSLSRALSVRAYLIDNGIGNLRINVQAEGDKNPGGEPDRVDVFLVK